MYFNSLIGHTALELLLCCTGFGCFIGGAWGMNLDNDDIYQNIPGCATCSLWVLVGGFTACFISSFLGMALMYYAVMITFTHTQVFPVTIIQMEIIPLFMSQSDKISQENISCISGGGESSSG
eukprot:gene36974-45608_t